MDRAGVVMSDEKVRGRDKPRGLWPYVWALWIGTFFLIEGVALVDDRGGDTLTEQLQYVGGSAPWLFTAGVAIFAVWLVVHFAGPKSRIWKYASEWRQDRAAREDTAEKEEQA